MGGAYGNNLTEKESAGQILVTKGCLQSGIALSALDTPGMKEAFLHIGVKLPSATHLGNYVGFILEEEARGRPVIPYSKAVADTRRYRCVQLFHRNMNNTPHADAQTSNAPTLITRRR